MESNSDSMQIIEPTKIIGQKIDNQQTSTLENKFETLVRDHKMMLKRVKTLEDNMKRHSATREHAPLSSGDGETTNAPITIEKITTIDDFLRFERAVSSDQEFRKNTTKVLIERLGDQYTADNRFSCALMIHRLLFSPDFFKLCSWSGRSRDETQVKFPIQKHKDFLEFFNSIVRESSSGFLSEIQLRNFFLSRIHNSYYSPKTTRYNTTIRKRTKKLN